jgi:hypothetical protein
MHFAEDGYAAGYGTLVFIAHGEEDRITVALQ